MTIRIVFETHSTTGDNENGIATGWLAGRLSELGREQATQLGARRRTDGIAAVFSSDLARSVETAEIAFSGAPIPVLLDWRLRECDYGSLNGSAAAELRSHRAEHIDVPYQGGESWRQAVARIASFVADLPLRWSGQRVLVIGHIATQWGLEHVLAGTPLEDLAVRELDWQPGWEYTAPDDGTPATVGAGSALGLGDQYGDPGFASCQRPDPRSG